MKDQAVCLQYEAKNCNSQNGPGNFIDKVELLNLRTQLPTISSTLWSKNELFKGTLILIIRRPGCAICRDEAALLASKRSLIESKFKIKMVCVIHQLEGHEELVRDYWKGDCYLDSGRGFYKALGNGTYNMARAITTLSNPIVWKRWRNAKSKGVKDSYSGEGRILGGLFIISSKGVHYSYVERLSSPPPMEEILTTCENIYNTFEEEKLKEEVHTFESESNMEKNKREFRKDSATETEILLDYYFDSHFCLKDDGGYLDKKPKV
ncbi:hypothetical protein HK099_008228 [Clydaea vesicula]|uniref:Peroxiredoxin-like 2A n=1 Tax=Clydaea vesicula TaxID=447962 RepID=A0AAD5TVJ9_9FUNG|nr:hypothetical protein HK099_008228 [Clydaea vesicula]